MTEADAMVFVIDSDESGNDSFLGVRVDWTISLH